MNSKQIINHFQTEMIHQGITPSDEIIADGELHRFHIKGDRCTSKNGWYVLHLNSISCGAYGSWKNGSSWKWSSKALKEMNASELHAQNERIKKACKARQTIKIQEQHEASVHAEMLWLSYPPATPNHAYLVKKHVLPFYARQRGKEIVLPITDFSGKIWSLQYISEAGSKRFLLNGVIKSHFIPLNYKPTPDRTILICEGFATAGTLAKEYPAYCVVAACDAGNLKPVALELRRHLPNTQLIIAADDDRLTANNPGIHKGREAAIAAGALFTQPRWPSNAPTSLTDFNDLACWLADNEVQHV